MPNRTICQVLSEMREAHKTHNYSYLPGLIEELQTMANRMESALYDQNDLDYARREVKKLDKKIQEMKDKLGETE
jgi:hypothetical protein